MKGEFKETSLKKTHRTASSSSLDTSTVEENRNSLSAVQTDLLKETLKTLAQETVTTSFNNLSTSYGPPQSTATINGSWTASNAGGDSPPPPGTGRRSDFARQITQRTAGRITHEVLERRSEFSLSENVETVLHRFDNTQGDSNLRGIY